MSIRRLTEKGRQEYRDWLATRKIGDVPPKELLEGDAQTEAALGVEIDTGKKFAGRYEFGEYVVGVFSEIDAKAILSQEWDGLWDWLTVLYFDQFGRKDSKSWHYTVTRRGHSGSLAYRHLARTAYEMYLRHGVSSRVMLAVPMDTWGDMSEQLTSRQKVAYHRGYIQAANALYMSGGKLRRGAAGRVKPHAKRKPGDTGGKGGGARLALAVQRLSRTYDTHPLQLDGLLGLLPKEFAGFMPSA
ncbi:hypothetical protein [Pseudoxanthomonas sp. z9]|uniref:hypothetical protein n=1 Tax=Pseudoxanthomonas sp. z9 TaxID=2584942 RepID=UPI001144F7CB|nr:hypothetical protein [Pseudoxanthomonas sp. z9]